MPLLVVRHAHAGRRSTYPGDDRDRPLSRRGAAQAAALVPVLSGFGPRRILSSPYARCIETVRPTAEILSLGIEAVDALAEGHEAETVRLVEELVAEPAVLCVHGDGAAAVLEWLKSVGGAGPDAPRLGKGDLWAIAPQGAPAAIVEHVRLSKRTSE